MPDSVMTRKQAAAWLLTAMLAPLAHASGAGWTTIAISAAILLPLWLLPGSFEQLPKPILYIQWGIVVLAAVEILPASGSYWPGSLSEVVVPIGLLLLAGTAENVRRSANAAGILCWMSGILGAVVLYMSVQGIRLEWLRPNPIRWNLKLILILLLPGLSALWENKPRKSMWGIAAAAVLLGILVQGNLGASVAESLNAPFYEMARSLRLGSLSRLEPVGSVMLTLSWFALCLYFVMGAKTLLRTAGIKEKPALWTGIAAMGLGIALNPQTTIPALPLAAVIAWFLIPFWNFKNFPKKDEKRC